MKLKRIDVALLAAMWGALCCVGGCGTDDAKDGSADTEAQEGGAGESSSTAFSDGASGTPGSEQDAGLAAAEGAQRPAAADGGGVTENPGGGDDPAMAAGNGCDALDFGPQLRGDNELIIDVSTLAGPQEQNPQNFSLSQIIFDQYSAERYPWMVHADGCEERFCFGAEAFQEVVHAGSDTDVALLLGLPYEVGDDGTGKNAYAWMTHEDSLEIRGWLAQQPGGGRTLFAATIMPSDRADLQWQIMERLAPEAVAWHSNTAWSPFTGGYFLDDELGDEFIERGLSLGVPIFLVPKGKPELGYSPTFADPRDVGPAAARHPQARFVVLRAGFEHGLLPGESSRPGHDPDADLRWGDDKGVFPEGPYDADDPQVQALYPLDRGVNRLITSLLDHGIGPNENVYAALDVVWAELMTRPDEAAHVLGKLLRFVGEDNVLWGTRSLLYGGPQPQIEAFRDFQIPEALRDAHGYPELTPELKAKILGVNAARLFCIEP
jgi:predicted TIM-barrel fold metal-dependent hydrolase